MAKKQKSASSGHDNPALSDEAVWTTDQDQVSIAFPPKKSSTHNYPPPDDDDETSPSAPDEDDELPDYLDISIVPEGAILQRHQVVPLDGPSAVVIERKRQGVNSFDARLDNDSDELWRYFMTYLDERPQLCVSIQGYHTEVKLGIYPYYVYLNSSIVVFILENLSYNQI
jgi:hypothetical protein